MQLILGFYSGIGELVEIVNRVVELEHDGVAAKLQLSNAFLASWQAIYSAFALYKSYHIIKKDGRYFIIPRDYGGFNGIAFYWPSKTPYSLLIKGRAEDDGGKSQITVFIESKRFRISNPDQPKIDLSNPESCSAPLGTPKSWNGLIVWLRFDDSHDKDWPQICLEIVRILSLVKEVKNHE